jgi:hypothetical protein
MPDVLFTNETDAPINVGVWAVWLHAYTNNLAPGNTWTVHLAGIPYTIEIRSTGDGHEFTPNTSREATDKIGAAWGQGTASVLTAVGWGLGMIGLGGPVAQTTSGAFTGRAFSTIGNTMDAAVKGELFSFCSALHQVELMSMYQAAPATFTIGRKVIY